MRERAFTLVELLVVLAVAGLLAAVAYPPMRSAVLKAHRGDALVLLGQVQLAQAEYRSRHPRYARLAELALPPAPPGGRYTLSEAEPGAHGYVVIAQAIGPQAADDACRFLRLEVAGAHTRQASGPSTEVANAAEANRRCWGR